LRHEVFGKSRRLTYANVQLYAYAKVAEGKDFSAAKKPGMFDLAVRLPACLPPRFNI
jgi:hypothetical protein